MYVVLDHALPGEIPRHPGRCRSRRFAGTRRRMGRSGCCAANLAWVVAKLGGNLVARNRLLRIFGKA